MKKPKIYTVYDSPPIGYEVNTEPSLTDESFYEPLNELVERIIRGESTTFMDAYKGVYDYDADDDAVLDNVESDFEMDDLTDIDTARDVIQSYQSPKVSESETLGRQAEGASDKVSSSAQEGDESPIPDDAG